MRVLLSANSPNKSRPSLMRSNPIGHTNFFTNERNRIGFSRLSGRPCEVIEMSVYNVPCLPRIMASRFVDVNLVEHFIEY